MIIRLRKDTYLSTDDGIILTKEQVAEVIRTSVLRDKNPKVNEKLSVISGRTQAVIPLYLKNGDTSVSVQNGFLVKVYLSSSSGPLKRMYKTNILDPADNSVVQGGFGNYIDLEFDV